MHNFLQHPKNLFKFCSCNVINQTNVNNPKNHLNISRKQNKEKFGTHHCISNEMFVGTPSSQFSLSGGIVECKREGRCFMIMAFPTNNLDVEQGRSPIFPIDLVIPLNLRFKINLVFVPSP
jgi:hypothetical protein